MEEILEAQSEQGKPAERGKPGTKDREENHPKVEVEESSEGGSG